MIEIKRSITKTIKFEIWVGMAAASCVFMLFASSSHAGIGQSYQCREQIIADVTLDKSDATMSDYEFQFTWNQNNVILYEPYDGKIEELQFEITVQDQIGFVISDASESDYGISASIERFDDETKLYSLSFIESGKVEVSMSECYEIDRISLISDADMPNSSENAPASSTMLRDFIEGLLN